MCEYAQQLHAAGYTVTSRWINGSHETDDVATDEDRRRLATEDMCDLWDADIVLNFTEPVRKMNNSRGGRHVEMGLALAWNKAIILVGPRENVFHYLVTHSPCENFEQATQLLTVSFPVNPPPPPAAERP